jgi:hypothetical protein
LRVTDRIHDLVREADSSGDGVSVENTFRLLAEKWKRETSIVSSVSKKVRHPAYREIIKLGPKAVPLILAELSSRPDHWFSALEEITGENPVAPTDKKSLPKAVQAWVTWGIQKGLELNA